jgi:DNA-3-methyladenine glycosylase I
MGIRWEEETIRHADGRRRCGWCGHDAGYVRYHDEEWGVPERNGARLFEKFVLDAFQAGLSWLLILRKRAAFRRAFAGFDPARVAAFDDAAVARLMNDAEIVRNRAKIEAAITAARIVMERGGPDWFAAFLWDFVDGRPLQPRFERREQVPDSTPLSARVSRELKRLGFRFCGPVTTYAFMQAVGMTNDHLVSCWRHEAIARAEAAA